LFLSWNNNLLAQFEYEKLTEQYGSFNLDEKDAAQAQAALEKIVADLKLPGDPDFKISFVNSKKVEAFVEYYRDSQNKKAYITISKGLLDLVDNESQLAGIIAHEMGHTSTIYNKTKAEHRIQGLMEEIVTADHGGMKRMLKAGYDPRSFREAYIKLAKRKGKPGKVSPFMSVANSLGTTHPDDGLRVSAMDIWLTKQEEVLKEFPTARPLASSLVKAKKSRHSKLKIEKTKSEKIDLSNIKTEKEQKVKEVKIRRRKLIRNVEKYKHFQELDNIEKAYVFERIANDYRFRNRLANYFFHKDSIKTKQEFNKILKSSIAHDSFYYWKTSSGGSPLHVYADDSKSSGLNKIFRKIIKLAENASEPTAKKKIVESLGRIRKYLQTDNFAKILRIQNYILNPAPILNLQDYKSQQRLLTAEQKYHNLYKLLDKSVDPHEQLKIYQQIKNLSNEITLIELPTKYAKILAKKLPSFIPAATEDMKTFKSITNAMIKQSPHYLENITYTLDKERKVESIMRKTFKKILAQKTLSPAQKIILFDANTRLIEDSYTHGPEIIPKFIKEDLTSLKDLNITLDELNKHGHYLEPGEIHQVMKDHPNWKYSIKEADKLIAYEHSWKGLSSSDGLKSVTTMEEIDRAIVIIEEVSEIAADPKVQKSFQLAKKQFSGPSYNYDLSHSKKMQTIIIQKLKDANEFPTDPKKIHRLLINLAQKGPTELTDAIAKKLYLDPHFDCITCMKEALHKKIIWDFETRLIIFRHLRKKVPHKVPVTRPRVVEISKELKILNSYFPESSLARVEAFESLANNIHANYFETRIIDAATIARNDNVSGAALRIVNSVVDIVKNPPEGVRRFGREEKFVKWLLDKGKLPPDLYKLIDNTVGISRFKEQYRILPPEYKATFLNSFLSPPHGIYTKYFGKRRLINLALSGVTGEQKTARLILESLLYSLGKVAPYQESLALSYILGQVNNKSGTAASAFRHVLESMGGTGASIAQKLYQRKMLPPEYLKELAHFTNQFKPPTRLEKFELIIKGMNIENIDEVVEIVGDLGSASSKVVVKVRYKDGRIDKLSERALKLLRANYSTKTENEIKKLDLMLEYLEKKGGKEYRKFRSTLESVKKGLRTQADLKAEQKVYPKVAKLYNETKSASKFDYEVIKPDVTAGVTETFVNEKVAKGIDFTNLTIEQQKLVYPAYFDKEQAILLARTAEDGHIYFEADRHVGNLKVDMDAKPKPKIYIFDYPLFTRIKLERRDSILKLMGLLEYSKSSLPKYILPSIITDEIYTILTESLAVNSKPPSRAMKRKIRQAIISAQGKKDLTMIELMYDVLAISEIENSKIHPSVYDYITSLGHLEHYSVHSELIEGKNPFQHKITKMVEESLSSFKVKAQTQIKKQNCLIRVLYNLRNF